MSLKPFTAESTLQPQKAGWDNELGFQYRELDAIWAARWNTEEGWQPGQLYEHQHATFELSPATNALHYGQSIFEGLKARCTKQGNIVLFRPIDNARRLRTSAARMAMEAPPVEAFLEGVHAVVQANERWVPSYRKGSLYLRPLLFGSAPMLGVAPSPEYTFCIFACPVGKFMGGDRVAVLSATHRAAPYGTGAAKAAGNYGASMQIKTVAQEMGYIDALYLDAREDRYVEELSAANFFVILKDGTLVTPQLGSILPGITRHSLLTIARELFGWITIERPLPIEEVLQDSVEAFYTGTAAVLSSITTVNYQGVDHPIGDGKPGPRAAALKKALDEIQLQEHPDHWNWVVKV